MEAIIYRPRRVGVKERLSQQVKADIRRVRFKFPENAAGVTYLFLSKKSVVRRGVFNLCGEKNMSQRRSSWVFSWYVITVAVFIVRELGTSINYSSWPGADFKAAAYTCRPQITAKGICRRTWHANITSAVKPLGTFLSFKDFNLLMSLAPSARSFFNFMTPC